MRIGIFTENYHTLILNYQELIKEKKEYNCACFKYNNRLYLSNIEEVQIPSW